MAKAPRGDYRKLAKLIEATGRIANGELAKKSTRAIGDETFKLAKAAASAGQNPAGRKWKAKKRGGRALARVAATLKLQGNASGFRIFSGNHTYRYHQYGANRRGTKWRLPKRAILPTKAMPKRWQTVVVARLDKDFRDQMKI